MGEEETIFEWTEAFTGTIDVGEFYKKCYKFWKDGLGYDVFEKEHKYTIDEKGKKTWEITWEIKKEYDDFTKCKSELKLKIEVEEKEVLLPNGEKKKIQMSKGEVKFKAVLEKDKDKMPKGIFGAIFNELIYKPIYKKWKKQLTSDAEEFRRLVREETGGFIL